MVTALPCAASVFCRAQPRAEEIQCPSKSLRRRRRLRRVAIRHAQQQACAVKSCLGSENARVQHQLRADVVEFYPLAGDHTFDDSKDAVSQVTMVLNHLMPTRGVDVDANRCCARTVLREIQRSDVLPDVSIPALQGIHVNLLVKHMHPQLIAETYELSPPRILREPNAAEKLPTVSVSDMDDVVITCAAPDQPTLHLNVGEAYVFARTRVYKHPYADRSLRGCDLRSIGEGSPLRDKPMMLEGTAELLELGDQRFKVSGRASVDQNGELYRVRGWVCRESMLDSG